MHIQTPSPRRPPFRTQDSNVAWAAAEGLLPIPEGFTAPGYVPANVVGGITYMVCSPQPLSPQTFRPSVRPLSVGRQLFAEFTGVGSQGNGDQRFGPLEAVLPQQITSQPRATSHLPQQLVFQEVDPPQRSTSQRLYLQQQQATSPDVRPFSYLYLRAYIDYFNHSLCEGSFCRSSRLPKASVCSSSRQHPRVFVFYSTHLCAYIDWNVTFAGSLPAAADDLPGFPPTAAAGSISGCYTRALPATAIVCAPILAGAAAHIYAWAAGFI